jgi:hypothetical protein
LDLVDFERRGEYVLAAVKSPTWFFECGIMVYLRPQRSLSVSALKASRIYCPKYYPLKELLYRDGDHGKTIVQNWLINNFSEHQDFFFEEAVETKVQRFEFS